MASLFSMPRPRGKRNEDNLLGMSGDIGMTDSSFQQMGRAPVDELFAGRQSAVIDDIQHLKDSTKAGLLMESLRDDSRAINEREGGQYDQDIRRQVKDQTGMYLYPGEVVGPQMAHPYMVNAMREFSDVDATLKDGWKEKGSDVKLGDILEHELLYQNYPEVANLPVSLMQMEPHRYGSYGGQSSDMPLGNMQLNSLLNDKDALDTILHETQHYIQDLEGWPGGGTVGKRATSSWERVQDDYTDWRVANLPSFGSDEFAQEVDRYDYDAYQNIAGEILARDVEDRNNARKALRAYAESVDADPEKLGRVNKAINKINTTYPASKRDHGNGFPHRPLPRPIDSVVESGMVLEAMRQRRGMGLDPDRTDPEHMQIYLRNLDNNLLNLKKGR